MAVGPLVVGFAVIVPFLSLFTRATILTAALVTVCFSLLGIIVHGTLKKPKEPVDPLLVRVLFWTINYIAAVLALDLGGTDLLVRVVTVGALFLN